METWSRGAYEIDTDQSRLDLGVVRDFLARSYWAKAIPLETVQAACRGSLCFGLRHRDVEAGSETQVGFPRTTVLGESTANCATE